MAASYAPRGGGGRGGISSFGYTNAANYSPDNYGRIVEGNARLSYGPWIDPEVQRTPHRPFSELIRKRHNMDLMGRIAF